LIDQFNQTAVTTIAPVAPKKRGMLPLLTVLFCISYGLMTMLIVEQGSTIESQRALIRELFRDSVELSATKVKAQKDKQAAATRAQSQNPSSQKPSTQAQTQQAPSSQAVPQRRNQSEKQKPLFKMPSRPAADQANDARAVITI